MTGADSASDNTSCDRTDEADRQNCGSSDTSVLGVCCAGAPDAAHSPSSALVAA